MIKFQTLAIIFVLMVVPISMLLTYYIDSQIDTIAIQNAYDTKLLNSTYDAIIAFELNTINNNGYSTNAESLRRDINASVKTFTTSLAKNLGLPGANANSVLPYIPAVVYTLYDGYYIYSPIENTTIDEDDNINTTYEHTLKPYVYYTARYYIDSNTDFVVNYSLDNYIVIYGKINGTYHSKAGYLTNTKKYEDNKITSSLSGDALEYYNASKYFTEFVTKELGTIKVEDMVVEVTGNRIITASKLTDESNLYYEFKGNTNTIFNIGEKNDPEVKTSDFWEHKNSVIKKSIQSNLNSAINNYTKQSEGLGTTYDYKMPILSATEWDKILSNVSIVTFMQGLQVGLKTYNNYMIVSSTGCRQFVDPEELYFVTVDSSGKEGTYYHRINCPELAEELKNNSSLSVEGYVNIDFKGIYDNEDDNSDNWGYHYNHTSLACYNCIVGSNVGGITYDDEYKDMDSNGASRGRDYATKANDNLITFVTKTNTSTTDEDGNLINTSNKDYSTLYETPGLVQKLRNAYYNALFKERFNQVKVSSYVNKAS